MQPLYKVWVEKSYYQEELAQLSPDDIEDRFYQAVPFGTGGMRGKLGAGTNRINVHTIRLVAEGLAQQIKSQGELAMARGVVIAYDTRHFSQEFAYETAGVLIQHNIQAYVMTESRPTPELSFAVRYFNAMAGVVITASHNPKEYNGFKVYGDDGAQLTPQFADEIVAHMNAVEDIFAIPSLTLAEVQQSALCVEVLEKIDVPYERAVATLSSTSNNKAFPIVYTPLHGAGLIPTTRILRNAGFSNVFVVEEQAVQDGAFPTVTSPNPEEADSFKLAMELGREKAAKLLLATDPDADRLGVAVWAGEDYQLLNGNQLGALLLHYILSTREIPKNAAMLKTIVTSEFGTAIAKYFNVETFSLLTGFKFIAEKIAEWEKTGDYRFMFGYEESYGYLAGDFVRDKDAVQIALLTAEMAAYYDEQGKTLLDALHTLYEQFGYYQEALISKTFDGIEGQKKIEQIMHTFRQNSPTAFAGLEVVKVEDYLPESIDGLPTADVIKFILSNGAWICVRPSGTEPKCKFYIGVKSDSFEQSQEMISMLREEILMTINKI